MVIGGQVLAPHVITAMWFRVGPIDIYIYIYDAYCIYIYIYIYTYIYKIQGNKIISNWNFVMRMLFSKNTHDVPKLSKHL